MIGAAAAKLQGKDAVAGAMGGATAAIVNPMLDLAIGGADGSGWGADPEMAQKLRFGTLQLASMATAAGIASATGKEGMTAALAAQNETVNNWLTPKEQELKWRAGKACDAGNARGCQIGALLNQRDASREATPAARFSSGFANALVLAGGGALLMPVEITKAVAEGRSVEFVIDALKGIAGMPEHLYKGLSSDDPALRGAAFAESMMVVAGSTALARSFSQGVKGQGAVTKEGERSVAVSRIENNAYRDSPKFESNYVDGKPVANLRLEYEQAARDLGTQADRMLASGVSEEQVARWAVAQRNQLKIEFRELTPPEMVAAQEQRNLRKYQDPVGPTADQLRAEGKSWMEMIKSSARPDGKDLDFHPTGFGNK